MSRWLPWICLPLAGCYYITSPWTVEPNETPEITFSFPQTPTTLDASIVNFRINATDPDEDPVTRVEFYANSTGPLGPLNWDSPQDNVVAVSYSLTEQVAIDAGLRDPDTLEVIPGTVTVFVFDSVTGLSTSHEWQITGGQ